MALVKMFISKFGREVLIDDDHPLAVAEQAKAEQPAPAAVITVSDGTIDVAPGSQLGRRKRRV